MFCKQIAAHHLPKSNRCDGPGKASRICRSSGARILLRLVEETFSGMGTPLKVELGME